MFPRTLQTCLQHDAAANICLTDLRYSRMASQARGSGNAPVLKRVREDDHDRMRSCVVISTLAQVVEELVLNAVDAECSALSCDLFPGDPGVMVSDNGRGFLLADLHTVGRRYATSKAGTEGSHAPHSKSMGFRGEALASLASLASLDITSRDPATGTTWLRVIERPHVDETVRASIPRAAGTQVRVRRLMEGMPVRRARLQSSANVTECVRLLQRLALSRPSVASCLRVDGKDHFTFRSCRSRLESVERLYGSSVASRMSRVEASSADGAFEVSGYAGLARPANDLQFVFVNGRFCKRVDAFSSQIRRVVDSYLGKQGAGGSFVVAGCPRGREAAIALGPGRKATAIGSAHKCLAVVLDLCCDPTRYDVALDPEKTLIEFDDWPSVLQCITAAIDAYFQGISTPVVALSAATRQASSAPLPSATPTSRDQTTALDDLLLWAQTAGAGPVPSARSLRANSAVLGSAPIPGRRRGLNSGIGQNLVPATAQPSIRMSGVATPPAPQTARCFKATQPRLPALPNRKPRLPNHLRRPSRAMSTPADGSSLSALVAQRLGIRNPGDLLSASTAAPCESIPCLRDHASVKSSPSAVSVRVASGEAVTRDCLRQARVVGQLDDKFILALASRPQHSSGALCLLCVDQHAADERVRVESIDRAVLGSSSRFVMRTQRSALPSLPGVLANPIEPPLHVVVSSMDARLLREARSSLHQWGWRFSLHGEEASTRVVVTHAPACLGHHFSEVPDMLRFARRVSSIGPRAAGAAAARPRCVSRLINSRACRGAIMFGDSLTLQQCRDLLSLLCRTHLPFQCAHGRPSVLPLAILQNECLRPEWGCDAVN
jgi:DNA mismatch repair protein MLH3